MALHLQNNVLSVVLTTKPQNNVKKTSQTNQTKVLFQDVLLKLLSGVTLILDVTNALILLHIIILKLWYVKIVLKDLFGIMLFLVVKKKLLLVKMVKFIIKILKNVK